jgi:lysophospholipase L1-like esterase
MLVPSSASRRLGLRVAVLVLLGLAPLLALATPARWVGAWASAPHAEAAAKDAQPLAGSTLRQVVRVSLGGESWRLRLSNAFGATPLRLHGVHLAVAASDGAIEPATNRAVTFGGSTRVTIPAGATYLSDPIALPLAAQADVALSLHFQEVPATLTIHGGSRAHSFLVPGDALAAPALPQATKVVRWYFLAGLDVVPADPRTAAVVLLGDSITDGYGTQPESYTRWTDFLVRRLAARPADAAPVGVLNVSIGGNHLTGEGLGPAALARFDRDVAGQAGARWLIVFEGVNDLGGRVEARKKGVPYASAEQIIHALRQIAARGRDRGLRVIGGTIAPYEGAFYWTAEDEADRQRVNDWIRTSGEFDAVIDFDLALRDPQQPTRLAPAYDSGDHLHPSIDGYRRIAETVDLSLFR